MKRVSLCTCEIEEDGGYVVKWCAIHSHVLRRAEAAEAQVAELQNDAMTMALRLLGESDDTFSPETFEVMSRWRPKAMALVKNDCA